MSATRLKHYWYVLFPVLLALFLYRRSFRIWFMKDDFAWLGLRLSVFNPGDFFKALFLPMAQGTVRFLSERAFFLGFESVFGLESLPMRLWMFATLAAGLVLLTLVAEELTKSRLAGVAAAVFWSLNFGLTVAMCWLSSYNQILVSTLLLAAIYAFMQYAKNLDRRWLAGAWLAYLLGFGALESIIALPALLLLWACLYARQTVRAALPFFGPAIAFLGLHLFLIPKTASDPSYRMHLDASLLESLGVYWRWLLGAVKLADFSPDYLWLLWPTLLFGTFMLAASLYLGIRRRVWAPVFGLAMSLAAIAPMLPLRDHRTDYYLASASIGIMICFASLLTLTPPTMRWALALCLLFYLYPSYMVQKRTFDWYLETTSPVRTIVRGAVHAHDLHPDKLILIDGIDAAVYGNTIADDGLRLIAGGKLRLAPGNGPSDNNWTLSPSAARAALEKGLARIYRLEGQKLRDVTREWEQSKGFELAGGFAPSVVAGEAAFASQFGAGWFGIEDGSRWMGKESTLRLGGGPFPRGAALQLRGYVPEALGSITLEIVINGTPAGQLQTKPGELLANIPLPVAVAMETIFEIRLRPSKTVRPPKDGRDLSLVFGQIALRALP